MQEYPLVQLQGNHRIVLEHYPKKVSNSGRYEVRMHEDDWVRLGSDIINISKLFQRIPSCLTGGEGWKCRPRD